MLIKYSEGIRKVYKYAEPNLTLIGWLGFVGFPLYYLVWGFMFPQPYESLTLRVLCSFLFLGLIYRNKLNARLRRSMHWFYLIAITIGLPFFFFYMLLMNEWSQIWVMSFMSAIFLHILLVHITWIMFAQTMVGISMAICLAWISNDFSLELTVDLAQLPVFFFTYLFGSLCFNRYQVDYDSKVALAKSFGAGIAHEMRNPLSSLSTSIDVIQTIVPSGKLKAESYELSHKEIKRLNEVSEDAMKVIQSGNETIDLLLTSIDENRISRTTFKKHSAREIIENAMDSFAYKSAKDKATISLATDIDFEFFGSDNLLKYVIFNLFKNSFYHCGTDDFRITVSLVNNETQNKIFVRDTGTGITPVALKNIFNDFYTTGKSGRYGLGLPFCKRVMCSFGGDIKCSSKIGAWTEFSLTFPKLNSDTTKEIKGELTKAKSVLLVSEDTLLNYEVHGSAKLLGFRLNEIDINTALSRSEYEFEYDVIILDICTALHTANALDALESLWTFTEARIVYLFKDEPVTRYSKPGYMPIWLELSSFMKDTHTVIDNLFFDIESIKSAISTTRLSKQGTRTVMIVDDNESLRKFTAVILEKEGFDVIQIEDGKQALDALETLDSEEVDLILMDIEMPVMDGIETTIQIRNSGKKFSNIPIIAHTGDNSHDMKDKIDASYMSGYLVKPAGRQQILNTISDWI